MKVIKSNGGQLGKTDLSWLDTLFALICVANRFLWEGQTITNEANWGYEGICVGGLRSLMYHFLHLMNSEWIRAMREKWKKNYLDFKMHEQKINFNRAGSLTHFCMEQMYLEKSCNAWSPSLFGHLELFQSSQSTLLTAR